MLFERTGLLMVSSLLMTAALILFIAHTVPSQPKPRSAVALAGNHTVACLLDDCDPKKDTDDVSWKDTYMALTVKARIGNHLFAYAALREFSTIKNSTPIILPDHGELASIFRIKGSPYLDINRTCFRKFSENRRNVSGTLDEIRRLQPGNISFHGYFQSPRYFETVKQDIRKEFVFVDVIASKARSFLQSQIPKEWLDKELVQVGIHVRRTDHVSYKFIEMLGFRFPPKSYFELAMAYFEERYERVQFVVVSDDIEWCEEFFRPFTQTIVFSRGHTPAEDLAIMAHCNHTIITIGTYSWWAGWLCRGTTIYYANYYRRPSWAAVVLHPRHYIPDDEYNHWIAIRHKDDKNKIRRKS